MEKAIRDKSGIELRSCADSSRYSETTRRKAVQELERRRANLRGACIPAWERAARGEKVSEWDVLGV